MTKYDYFLKKDALSDALYLFSFSDMREEGWIYHYDYIERYLAHLKRQNSIIGNSTSEVFATQKAAIDFINKLCLVNDQLLYPHILPKDIF